MATDEQPQTWTLSTREAASINGNFPAPVVSDGEVVSIEWINGAPHWRSGEMLFRLGWENDPQ